MQISGIPSAVQSALQGVKQAESGLAESAQNIANLNVEPQTPVSAVATTANNAPTNLNTNSPRADLSAEAVNLVVNEYFAKSNIKVIKTADEMMGTLIDTKV
jgi:flagellar hook protein FlgE